MRKIIFKKFFFIQAGMTQRTSVTVEFSSNDFFKDAVTLAGGSWGAYRLFTAQDQSTAAEGTAILFGSGLLGASSPIRNLLTQSPAQNEQQPAVYGPATR